MAAVTIPVMGHDRPLCQILEALCVDYIDESEVLTPAANMVKHNYKAPFVCGCRDLGEALKRKFQRVPL